MVRVDYDGPAMLSRAQEELGSEKSSPDVGLWLVAAVAAAGHEPLTSTGKPRWLATYSCGWERACSSEWAA